MLKIRGLAQRREVLTLQVAGKFDDRAVSVAERDLSRNRESGRASAITNEAG